MLDADSRWSEALTSNNIKSIIIWLETLTAKGDQVPPAFSSWVQRTSEFAKKELITLCFSRCRGLWMFLDRSSFTRVHVLLQRLRNLLTLAQWDGQRRCSAHLWHGVGVPCSVCVGACSADVRRGCRGRAHRVLRQHIWLGQLVQWWGIMGLLPKFPEAQEVKRITQMWRDMEHSHRRACLDTTGEKGKERKGFSSLIQGMVTHLDRQHGRVWTSGDDPDARYPPPNLQALLKLVLVPHVDSTSVQAIFMYFVQDVASFLQCKDDLLQSFCHAFTVPAGVSQQVKGFWMFDHGHIRASMEILLSPRACAPCLPWQHHCIIRCLLARKQPQVALRYLQWTRPAIRTPEDAKLFAEVLLQCSCVSDAWALLKKGPPHGEDVVVYFRRACEGSSLRAEAFKYIPAGCHEEENCSLGETKEILLSEKGCHERPPRPLSARLYQAQRDRAITPDDLVGLAREAALEVRRPRPRMSEVAWPEHTEERGDGGDVSPSAQALQRLSLSPSSMDLAEDTEQTTQADVPDWEAPVIHDMHLQTGDLVSSSEDLRPVSVSSFASASPLSPLKRDHAYEYERTLTLQRISSLLTDGDTRSSEEEEEEEEEDEEDESETLSSTSGSQSYSELAQTLDGARGSDSHIHSDSPAELMLSAEEDVFPEGEDFSCRALSGPNQPNERLDVQSQSVPESLLGEGSSCDSVSSAPVIQEHPSHRITSQPAAPHCSPERGVQQKARQLHRQDKLPLSQDSTSETSETTPDVLAAPHQSGSLGAGDQEGGGPLSGSSSVSASPALTSGSACDVGTTPAPPCPTRESPAGSQSETDEARVSGTSAWFDLGAVGGLRKQGGGDASPPAESGDASADNRRPSFVLGQSYTYSLGHFMDFTARQQDGDGRQAAERGKLSQGAMRSGRTAARRGKRLKRT